MHIETVAHQMFCKKYKSKLHFMDVEGERQYWLASIFYIRCEQCIVQRCHVNYCTSQTRERSCIHYISWSETLLNLILTCGMLSRYCGQCRPRVETANHNYLL